MFICKAAVVAVKRSRTYTYQYSSSAGLSLPTAAVDVTAVVQVALRKAFDGGSSGASAAFIQVVSLMWLRYLYFYPF